MLGPRRVPDIKRVPFCSIIEVNVQKEQRVERLQICRTLNDFNRKKLEETSKNRKIPVAWTKVSSRFLVERLQIQCTGTFKKWLKRLNC